MSNINKGIFMLADSVTGYIPTPPDGGWGWLVVLASFLNHVVVDGIAFTFGVFFIEFQEHFQSTKAQTALVGSLLAGFYLISGRYQTLDEFLTNFIFFYLLLLLLKICRRKRKDLRHKR